MGDALLLGDDRNGVGIPFGELLALASPSCPRRRAAWRRRARDGAPSRGRPRRAAPARSCGPSPPGRLALFMTTLRFLIRTLASNAASIEDCSAPRCAAPPIWKVRMVSCVPGSPIDCAAMTPTASPILTDGAAREIAAIALAADADLGLAGQHRADEHASMPARSISSTTSSSMSSPAATSDLAVQRIDHVDRRGAAEDAVAERRDHLAAVDDGAHREAAGGAAIHLGDDGVLRHVDQTAGEIARVRRLERGIGQALARAVGRVEVLEHGQAFLEVRDDRRLDDFARGLGHQAAHAGELLDLRRRAAGAGMRPSCTRS